MTDDGFPERVAAALAYLPNADPSATFLLDSAENDAPGLCSWHGDAEADAMLGAVLGRRLHPLFVDPVGATSLRTRRTSAATLSSTIGKTHLRGNTQASSFRRSLAAVLWTELDLRCERPKLLDRASNARLTEWMLEHLSVVTLPFGDRTALAETAETMNRYLDPPFNLTGYWPSPARRMIRARRKRYFSLATADAERIRRIADMERLVKLDPDGGDFLRRRLEQELQKLATEWAS